MRYSRQQLAGMALLVGIGLLVLVWFLQTHMEPRRAKLETQGGPFRGSPDQRTRINDIVNRLRGKFRGSPDHRRRIDAIVDGLRQESFDGMVQNLNDDESYQFPGYHSPRKGVHDYLDVLFSSRRTVKLWAALEAMPREEALAKSREIFSGALAEQQATVARVFKYYEEPNQPENTQSLLANAMALAAAIWFTGQFGGTAEVLAQIDQVDAFANRSIEHVAGRSEYSEAFPLALRRNIRPDTQFMLNAMVQAARHDSRVSKDELQVLEASLKALPAKQITLTAWDAQTTAYDFTHVVQGAPVDTSRGARTLTVYEWGPLLFNKQAQNEYLTALRDAIERAIEE